MQLNTALARDSIYEFFAKEIAYGRPMPLVPTDYQSRRINYSHDYYIDITGSQKTNPEWVRQMRYLFLPHTYTDESGVFLGTDLQNSGLDYIANGLESRMELDQGRAIDPRIILLDEWGYSYYKVIDSPNDGFFAWIFTSNPSNSLPNILAIRGTEFNKADEDAQDATNRDLLSDLARSIGINQYQAVRTELETVMGQANSNGKGFTVTGHSLGGALAQHVLVGASKNVYDIIEEVVTFMSPGIGASKVRLFESRRKSRLWKQAERDIIEAETGVCSPDPPIHIAPAIRHHVNYGDFVDLAGMDRILDHQTPSIYRHYADLFFSGKKTFEIAHSMQPHSLTSCATHPNIVFHNQVTDHLEVSGLNFRAIFNQRHKAQDFAKALAERVAEPEEYAKGAQLNPKFFAWSAVAGHQPSKRLSHHYEYAPKSKFEFIEFERRTDGKIGVWYLRSKLKD